MKFIMAIFLVFSFGSHSESEFLKNYKAQWKKDGCPFWVSRAAKGKMEVDTLCRKYVDKNKVPVPNATAIDVSPCPCEKAKQRKGDNNVPALCREEIIARSYYIGKGRRAKKYCPDRFSDTSLTSTTCFLDSEKICVDALVLVHMIDSKICPEEQGVAESEIAYHARNFLRELPGGDDRFEKIAQGIITRHKEACVATLSNGQRTDMVPTQQENPERRTTPDLQK